MKTIKNKILQVITTIYCVVYFIGFIIPFFTGEMSLSKSQDISVLIAFLFFLSGFIISWFNEKIGGYLLQAWVMLIWALGLFFWPDAYMVMVLAVPVLVIGVFLNRKVYLKSAESMESRQLDWKYTIQLFLHNYVFLYLLVVISDLTRGKYFDYLSMPFILFPILLILFIAGVTLSYRKEFIAGIIFLGWYIIVIIGSVFYFDFYNTGPWFAFGIAILIHGILYLVYHFKIKTKKINS
jgi:hypothetical protein